MLGHWETSSAEDCFRAFLQSYGPKCREVGPSRLSSWLHPGTSFPWRVVPLKLLVTLLYFTSAGTLGAEGPVIQITTAVIGMIGWGIGIRSLQTQSLLAMLGFSCGFSASFRAPLAGILFALEELQSLSSRMQKAVILMLIVASMISTSVAWQPSMETIYEMHLSEETRAEAEAGPRSILRQNLWMLLSMPIGALCAGIACAAIRLLRILLRFQKKAVEVLRMPLVFAFQGLLVSCIGAAVYRITGLKGVWGIGGNSLTAASQEGLHYSNLAIFAVGKLLATIITVACQCPGDVLEPVLVTGRFLGAFLGNAVSQLFPTVFTSSDVVGSCTVFGMAGLFAACFRFPLTPIVLTLELTGTDTYSIIVPLALCCFTANILADKLGKSLLHEIMEHDGVDIRAIAERAQQDLEDNICEEDCSGGDCESNSSGSLPEDPQDHVAAKPSLIRVNSLHSLNFTDFLKGISEGLQSQLSAVVDGGPCDISDESFAKRPRRTSNSDHLFRSQTLHSIQRDDIDEPVAKLQRRAFSHPSSGQGSSLPDETSQMPDAFVAVSVYPFNSPLQIKIEQDLEISSPSGTRAVALPVLLRAGTKAQAMKN